ncbi:MAG TPA: M48 family metallopeptidase [Kofleriaceae bacterium]|jgi:hypothetical protein
MKLALCIVLVAGCAAQEAYLGTSLPRACGDQDVDGCVGWMVERDLSAAELDIYDDAALRDYVQHVADKLAKHSRLAKAPRIVIANHDGTYATSGSRIVIGRPTIEQLRTEAELAGVLAHEIVHVEGRHASASLYASDDDLDERRDAEAIADERAVSLLEQSGYAPGAMARALQQVVAADDDEHPLKASRVARVQALAAGRVGYEGREAFLAAIDGMVVGRDSRLGHRVGDAWVVSALGIALDLDDDDLVFSTSDVLSLRKSRVSLVAYAIGAPWGHELVGRLADANEEDLPVGHVTIGTLEAAPADDSPIGKLAAAVRETLPQPTAGTRVAILERKQGALVIELGGRTLPRLALRAVTDDEAAASEPPRLALAHARTSGAISAQHVCKGRLLDDPELIVVAGEAIKCADRALPRRLRDLDAPPVEDDLTMN